jgi:hypothetical protein
VARNIHKNLRIIKLVFREVSSDSYISFKSGARRGLLSSFYVFKINRNGIY